MEELAVCTHCKSLKFSGKEEARAYWNTYVAAGSNCTGSLHFLVNGQPITVNISEESFYHCCSEHSDKGNSKKRVFSLKRAEKMGKIRSMVSASSGNSSYKQKCGYISRLKENSHRRVVIYDESDQFAVVIEFSVKSIKDLNEIQGKLITTFVADRKRTNYQILQSPEWSYENCLRELGLSA
ncbi:hypothetical protein KIMH_11360 [Bombiscardovia apis]|uniref:Uncharacterized protein n=1 Tax=Bombiscardovia apis TaxID=2932182 RepID=A0ABN6SJW9_9BIFI|nr:hypothetical protein [Bombiscardovia apis]BDR55025.1 hypothetical protein KIMH_11360 [Bombiscardovia apis]